MRKITNFCLVQITALGLLVSLFSCEGSYTPKPRGYFRIQLPKKEYRLYTSDAPYTFEYPSYAIISKDTDRNTEPYWINIFYPKFKGQLHVSYKPLKNNLNKYIEDSRTLAYKHTVKADAIDEETIQTPNHVWGTMYLIEGNTASSTQFFITDSIHHFLRASLYFNIPPKSDSLAPVLQFIKKDLVHMIKTFRWKDSPRP
jgi:gliding motility-associated lipoprotein GldD